MSSFATVSVGKLATMFDYILLQNNIKQYKFLLINFEGKKKKKRVI